MRVRSPLLAHSLNCFLFLQVLRCFSSLSLLLLLGNPPSVDWVAPFGNLRIKTYLRFPVAYRSLSRPSSPLRAKAFPIRPSLLLLTNSLYHHHTPFCVACVTYLGFFLCARLIVRVKNLFLTRPLPQIVLIVIPVVQDNQPI